MIQRIEVNAADILPPVPPVIWIVPVLSKCPCIKVT